MNLLVWHSGMLVSTMVLLRDAGLGRNHCSTGYMFRWMMGA